MIILATPLFGAGVILALIVTRFSDWYARPGVGHGTSDRRAVLGAAASLDDGSNADRVGQ